MLVWALVASGGALGAVSRYAVDRAVNSILGTVVVGTFVANVSGSFLLGIVVAAVGGRIGLSEEARAFVAVGFLGSYTTFSTLAVATVQYSTHGDWARAGLNVVGSVVIGVIAALAGILVGRAIF